jgi:Zn finger protein HypA/HybF involved in hydrogenase expression
MAVRGARCPKDGGKVYETAMPEVVCEKCSTVYILAIHGGTFFTRWKLVEKQKRQPTIHTESREVIQREIVKVPCKFCGNLNELATARFCPSCGAAVK